MNLLKGALQDELDNFFKQIHDHPTDVREVSKAAFSKARKNLKYTAFIELNQDLVTQSYSASDTVTWYGYRLCAVDGSMLRLPNKTAIADHFGRQQENSVPQARLSQLFDVLNKVTLDAQLSPLNIGERELAFKHLMQTEDNDLIIYDRGYPGFLTYAMHRAFNRNFIIRVSVDFCTEVSEFLAQDETDLIINIEANDDAVQSCFDHDVSSKSIKVRFIKVILDTGETEILATSLLDCEKFPKDIFQDLYFKRWGVEEDYKTKKFSIEIENFSGYSVESIYQDVHAKVLTQNMVALVAWIAQPEVDSEYKNRKHVYKVNLNHAISKMKNVVVLLITTANPKNIIRALVDNFVKTVEPIRKNRTYPRNKSWCKRVFHMNRKRTN